jgi:hypothetical protein
MTDQAPHPRGSALSRLSRGEKLVGLGIVLTLVSFVLPWMSAGGGVATLHAFHGAGLLTVLAWLFVVALFVARSPMFRNTLDLPKMPATEAVLFAIGGAVQLVGLLLFYGQSHSGRSIQFGFLLALIGAVLTTVAGITAVRSGSASLHVDDASASAPGSGPPPEAPPSPDDYAPPPPPPPPAG